jgi:hypothetical protein
MSSGSVAQRDLIPALKGLFRRDICLRVSCDVSPHGNHLSTLQWGHDKLDLIILSSILCLLADLFPLPAFDRIMIRFIVHVCFDVGTSHCLYLVLHCSFKEC